MYRLGFMDVERYLRTMPIFQKAQIGLISGNKFLKRNLPNEKTYLNKKNLRYNTCIFFQLTQMNMRTAVDLVKFVCSFVCLVTVICTFNLLSYA